MDATIESIVTIQELSVIYQELLNSISDSEVLCFAKSDERFKRGGFRTMSSALVRSTLLRLYADPLALPEGLKDLLRDNIPTVHLLAILNEDAIDRFRRYFFILWGKSSVIFALLLDPRKEMCQRALDWMERSGDELPECDLAQRYVNKAFQAMGLTAEGSAVKQTQMVALRDELTQAHVRVKRLQGAEDQARRLKQQLENQTKALAEMTQQAETYRKEARSAQTIVATQQADLTREASQREMRLAAELEYRLSTEFHGWLKPATAVLDADPVTVLSLQDKFDVAFEAQLHLDRGVAAHLNDIRRTQALSALSYAVNRHPGLIQLVEELAGAMRTEDDSPSPYRLALEARIHVAQQEDFTHLRTHLEHARSLKLLTLREYDALMALFHKRAATWVMTDNCEDKDAAFEEDESAIETLYPQLARAMSGRDKAFVLIDGHNMLYGLPGRYSPQRGKPLLEGGKRDRLVKDVVKAFFNLPASRAWILFDGSTQTEISAAENVRVSYSGGKGEHRADRVLVDLVRFFKQLNDTTPGKPTPIYLVSNDNGLCGEAQKQGAVTISVHHFAAFLR